MKAHRAGVAGAIFGSLITFTFAATLAGDDVQVNDSSGESTAVSHTQAAPTVAFNRDTSTLCAAFVDSFHQASSGQGLTGIARSTTGGLTWDDRGALGAGNLGDPSLVWMGRSGTFYLAVTMGGGAWLYRSDDDCRSFVSVDAIHFDATAGPTRLAAAPEWALPHGGRLYAVWIDGPSGRITSVYSVDGGATWSAPLALSELNASVGNPWPATWIDGEVYVAWARINPSSTDFFDIEVARSNDGGASFFSTTRPLEDGIVPRDVAASIYCGQPALNGDIAYAPEPRLAVWLGGALHLVYARDPDGVALGDDADVFYRRSTDDGQTWEAEVRISDDTTLTDQFAPSLSLGSVVSVAWRDRRLDPSRNLSLDTYARVSRDQGVTWGEASVRVSDISSPVYQDPLLGGCYHGDRGAQVQDWNYA